MQSILEGENLNGTKHIHICKYHNSDEEVYNFFTLVPNFIKCKYHKTLMHFWQYPQLPKSSDKVITTIYKI